MELRQLIEELSEVELIGDADVEVSSIRYDSRQIEPGSLFVAVPGFKADGHEFIAQALAQGAVALAVQANRHDLWQEVVAEAVVPILVVPDSRQALAALAVALHGHPGRRLGVIGVTGTDGKTSVVHLISHLLGSAGWQTGMISTAGTSIEGKSLSNLFHHTTPEAPEVQSTLAQMAEAGCRYAVIESSSHGLALRRLDGCEYDIGVLTNIGKDHLDFHRSQEAYVVAKARLFTMLSKGGSKGRAKTAILNVDDPSWQRIKDLAQVDTVTYGIHGRADVQAGFVEEDGWGSRFLLVAGRREASVRLARPGRFNVYNALAAAASALSLGMKLEDVASGLESWSGVPGRMELIEEGQPFQVVVDYAHAPGSLQKVLELLRSSTSGRLIVVFGGAGERSPERREPMGGVAAALADYTILTADDPRGEKLEIITDQIATGLRAGGKKEGHDFVCVHDRAEAVAQALAMASDGDTVLLAGKGNEQIIRVGDQQLEHDDREVARRFLQNATSGR